MEEKSLPKTSNTITFPIEMYERIATSYPLQFPIINTSEKFIGCVSLKGKPLNVLNSKIISSTNTN